MKINASSLHTWGAKDPSEAVTTAARYHAILEVLKMVSLLERLFTAPAGRRATPPAVRRDPRVLAVTADLCFYAGILNAAAAGGWVAEWASTLTRAIEICRSKSVPVLIYDVNLPKIEWETAFDFLGELSNCPRLVLAASSINEELWRSVLAHHGYDVVERSATAAGFRRMLQFAWLSLARRAGVLSESGENTA